MKQINILIVEDEPIAMKVNCMILEKLGFNPDSAANGNDALKMSSNRNYDLIFMDIGLPDINGIEVTTKIRQQEAGTDKRAYIIALTGFALEEVKKKCFDAGMDDIAAKPIAVEELKRKIEKYFPDCS